MKVIKTKETNNAGLFIGQIIEVFENFLEEHDIDIPNEEKAESDEPALIYGTDYGDIQSELEGLLLSWGVLEKEECDRM